MEVKQATGQGRYDQIVEMIQRSEQLKSAAEAKASTLADRLVPYTFAGSLVSLALTRNVTRALSVLMVDFSCALSWPCHWRCSPPCGRQGESTSP